MPVSFPHPLTDGTTAYGSHVKADLDVVGGKFTEGASGIADADISSAAAIKGTKLSSVAGSRIPTDRIEDDAVTFDKLRDDAAVDANRSVGTNHLRDAAVTKGKISTTAGQKVTLAQMAVTVTQSAATVIGATSTVLVGSGVVKSGRTLLAMWLRDATGGGGTGPVFCYEDTAGLNFQARVVNGTGIALTVRVVFAWIEST